MSAIKTSIVAILSVGLLAGSTVGVFAPDPATESPHGEPGLDVRELEWARLDLDEATFGPGARLTDIAASDSLVVIGGSVDGNAAVWTSTDRVNWRRVPHDRKVFGGPHQQVIAAMVPWRDGFVAAGEVRGIGDFRPARVAVVWISKDGTTWERVPHDEAVFGGKGRQEMFDIAASDDRLVVVGFDEEGPCCSNKRSDHDLAIWTSRNGTDWKKHTRASHPLHLVVGTSGGFIATGGGVWTSRNGRQWSAQPKSGLSGYQASFATGPDGLVAVGAVSDGPDSWTYAIWTSPDGSEWSRATIDGSVHLDDATGLSGVASSESGMAALVPRGYFEDGDGAIIVSADGQTWLTGNTPAEIADADLYRVAAIGPHFVAIGGGPMGGGMPTIWTTFEPGSDMQAEQSSETRRATSTALAAADAVAVEPGEEAEPVDTSDSPGVLPGVDLVTEEVEPGVYRVLNDGVRDVSVLPAENPRYLGGVMDTNIAAGPDGSVWLFGLDGFFRLGEEARHGWHQDFRRHVSLGQADFEVGPDGVIWLHHFLGGRKANNARIWSFDGESWTTRRKGAKSEWLYGVEVQNDGTVWTAWHTDTPTGKNKAKQRATAARLGANGWEELPGTVNSGGFDGDLVISDSGGDELWLMSDRHGRLRRHDGSGWVVERTPQAGGEMRAAVGTDGTLWVRLHPTCGHGTAGDRPNSQCWGPSDILARFDGDAWEVFGPKDGLPMMGDHYMGFEGFFEVAPNRSVWFNPIGDYEAEGSECDGIANYDGLDLRRYLRGHCITAMDMAPDGRVWLRAFESDLNEPREGSSRRFEWIPTALVHTYVITPEAVAAAE